MSGPLPDPNAVRRKSHPPTVPTTSLPVSGRLAPAPDVPSWVELGSTGRAWWGWAWSTPQSLGWGDSVGMEGLVARRAALEDDLTTLDFVHNLDFLDDVLEADKASALRDAIQRLTGMASGRLQVMKEMRELDDRLGLTPKGLAALRWVIVADTQEAAPTASPDEVAKARARRDRLASGE